EQVVVQAAHEVGLQAGQIAGGEHHGAPPARSAAETIPPTGPSWGTSSARQRSPSASAASRSPPTATTPVAPAARSAWATRRAIGTPSTSTIALSTVGENLRERPPHSTTPVNPADGW